MVWCRCPRLRTTLVVDVDDEGYIDGEDGDKDENSALALIFDVDVDVDDEAVGRRDGALGRETGQGGLSSLSSTETLSSPFNPG